MCQAAWGLAVLLLWGDLLRLAWQMPTSEQESHPEPCKLQEQKGSRQLPQPLLAETTQPSSEQQCSASDSFPAAKNSPSQAAPSWAAAAECNHHGLSQPSTGASGRGTWAGEVLQEHRSQP